MSIPRRVEAEWLDELPVHDPRAQRSRRELARVNALMANAGIVADCLRAGGTPDSIVELGAGDGRFAARLARALGEAPPGARMTLVDRQPSMDIGARARLEALGWRVEVATADAIDWLGCAPAQGAIVANLFLHHLDDDALARLLALAAGCTRRFVACEPRRPRLAGLGARMLGAIGCGPVTRHDAVASVRAGFCGGELTALWPREAGWATEEGARGLFSHAFVAQRP
jgi:SAM-dependent methyltransferase